MRMATHELVGNGLYRVGNGEVPGLGASSARNTASKRKSPSSSLSAGMSPSSRASSSSQVSSSTKGRSDCSVCSRSHGQPSGPRSVCMIHRADRSARQPGRHALNAIIRCFAGAGHLPRQRHVARRADDRLRLRRRAARRIRATAARGRRSTSKWTAARRVLVDTSTDLRQQALAIGVAAWTRSSSRTATPITSRPRRVRRFNALQQARDPVLRRRADARRDLRRMFCYVFDAADAAGRRRPAARAVTRSTGRSTSAACAIVPVPLSARPRPILGFRSATFAYLTDCSAIPDESWPLLDGRRRAGARRAARPAAPDALHASPRRSTVAERIGAAARPTSPTSATTCRTPRPTRALPAGVELAYDGLRASTVRRSTLSVDGRHPLSRTIRARRAGRSRCWRSATSTACTAAT